MMECIADELREIAKFYGDNPDLLKKDLFDEEEGE